MTEEISKVLEKPTNVSSVDNLSKRTKLRQRDHCVTSALFEHV